MSSLGPITLLIQNLKAGDEAATDGLFHAYYPRLVGLVRKKLDGRCRRVADEEDIVISAFDSFCRGAVEGKFPRLTDRDDLWRLLLTIAVRKVSDLREQVNAQKRGQGRVRGDSVFGEGPSSQIGLDSLEGDDLEPDVIVQLAEEFELLLRRLADPDDPELPKIAIRKMEGYTNAEIARELNCSVPTIGRRLAVIRNILKAEDKESSGG